MNNSLQNIIALLSFIVIAFGAQRATALELLPSCAERCVDALSSSSICVSPYQQCFCSNEDALDFVDTCVRSSCTIREQLVAKKFSQTICHVSIRDRTTLISGFGLGGGIIAIFTFGLRIVARMTSRSANCGIDDYFMALAMLAIVPFSLLSIILARNGLGRDMWTLSPNQITRVLYIYYIDESLYLVSTALTKASILYFYRRVFPDKHFRRATAALIGGCFAYLLTFTLVSVFQCRPISAAWEHWDGDDSGNCNNVNAQGWACAATNIVLDICIILLPLPQLSKLKMTLGRKARLLAIFSVGLFVTLISILRLESLIEFAKSENPTWDYVSMGYWSTIEVHTGVVCACMPAISSLLFGRVQTPAVSDENHMGGRLAYRGGKDESSVHICRDSLELEQISRLSNASL